MSEPNFHCPKCHTRSELIVGLTQAFCTNEADCNVFSFNPSMLDGGMSQASEIDLSGIYKEGGIRRAMTLFRTRKTAVIVLLTLGLLFFAAAVIANLTVGWLGAVPLGLVSGSLLATASAKHNGQW